MLHKVSACRDGTSEVLYSKHFVTSQKRPYHVTFDLDVDLEHILDAGSNGDNRVHDLDLDLEHTLDVGPCGDHRVQVCWRSSHVVCGRRRDFSVRRKVSVSRDL